MFRVLCYCLALIMGGRPVVAEVTSAAKPLSIRYTAALSHAASNGTSQPSLLW